MKKYEPRKIVFRSCVFTLITIICSFLFYCIINLFPADTSRYAYFWFFKAVIFKSFSYLEQIPAITISGTLALLTIFFTIIALSFNLNAKIPDKIIDKYILNSNRVTGYLSMLLGFLIIQLGILLTNSYDIYWSYVFILNLIISIIATVIFFYWFIRITNKKGLFKLLEMKIDKEYLSKQSANKDSFGDIPNISVESSGDYTLLKSKIFNPKTIPINAPEIITSQTTPSHLIYDQKEGFQHHSFAHISGLVNLDVKELKSLIQDNIGVINYIIVPKDKVFITQMGLLSQFCFYTEDERKKTELINKLSRCFEIVEITAIEEINDWILFLDHSRNTNPKEIDDDFIFLRKVLTKLVTHNQLHLMKLIFDTLQNNFNDELRNNDKILEQTISLVYSLRKFYVSNHQLLSFIQGRFKSIILNYSTTLDKKYSSRYTTAILYLSEFVRYEFMKNFEKENSLAALNSYETIINDNIEFSAEILNNTINLYFKKPRYYEVYLKEHMQQFISGLQFYYDDPYHYDRNYYDLSGDNKEIIDKKCQIIRESKEKRKRKITNSAFFLLNLIEEKKVPSELASLVLEFLDYGNVYADIDPAPSWIMREKLHPEGAFVVPSFPKEMYTLVYLIYSDYKKNNIPVPKWEFNKLHSAEELKKKAEIISFEDIILWFDIKIEKFEEIKNKLVNLFTQAITKCNEDEQKKIIDSKIDSDLTEKFEESINTYFKDNAVLRKLFIKYKNYASKLDKKPKKEADKSFGFYFVFEKSYFIKNPPVPWARTLESDYGMSLARNENEHILKEILSSKRIQPLKKSLEISIVEGIRKFGLKENLIMVVDSSKEGELSKMPSFTHKYRIKSMLYDEQKHHSFVGLFKYNNTEIPVYEFNTGAIIILDLKNISKLVQYSPYGKIYKEIYVGVDELDNQDLVNLKDIEFPKTKVKVRILEKFRIENINKKAFHAYKLSKENK